MKILMVIEYILRALREVFRVFNNYIMHNLAVFGVVWKYFHFESVCLTTTEFKNGCEVIIIIYYVT